MDAAAVDEAPQDHRSPRPLESAALLEPAGVLALQRSGGNQAVLQRLKARHRMLQRADTGLKEAARTSSFAKDALAYWKDAANKDKPLTDFATHLMQKANAEVKALGSHEVTTSFKTTGADSGMFFRDSWSIEINTTRFSTRSAVTKVGQLTLDEVAEVADTIYHEMRHSEQYFRIARMQAGRSTKTKVAEIAAEIESAMTIPPAVALAAANAPLASTKANEPLLAEAKDWESITLGFHGAYKNAISRWILETRDALEVLGAVAAANVTATKAKLGAYVASWTNDANRSKFVDSHLPKVEALATKSPLDTVVIKHLKAIKVPLAKVVKAWKDVEDNWATDTDAKKLQRLKAFKAPLSDLDTVMYAAYRDHLHEKDAWETGAAVGAAVRKLGKKP